MSLINCKVELKLIIFTIKDTKLYVPAVTLSTRSNQKLSKLLSKGFGRSIYWNEYKTKRSNKNTTNEFRYFLDSNLVRVDRLFVLVYWNRNSDVKQFKTRRYYLPKIIIKNYYVIMEKTFIINQLIQI